MSLVSPVAEIKWRGTQLTGLEALGGQDTISEPTPKRELFTYYLASLKISEVSKPRLKANCFKFFSEESQIYLSKNNNNIHCY